MTTTPTEAAAHDAATREAATREAAASLAGVETTVRPAPAVRARPPASPARRAWSGRSRPSASR